MTLTFENYNYLALQAAHGQSIMSRAGNRYHTGILVVLTASTMQGVLKLSKSVNPDHKGGSTQAAKYMPGAQSSEDTGIQEIY